MNAYVTVKEQKMYREGKVRPMHLKEKTKQNRRNIRFVFHVKTNSIYEVLTEGMSVSPMSIPKISVKVTGCPEAFLVHRAWI